MAPELYQGRPPSQASDLFALGVVLHEVFTGQKPVVASDSSPVIVSPRLHSSGVPSTCAQFIAGCLDRDPERRCQAFDRILDSLHIHYQTKPLWTRLRFAGAATAAIAALAGVGWWKWDDVEIPASPAAQTVRRVVELAKNFRHPRNPNADQRPGCHQAELTNFETLDQDLFVISPDDADSGVTNADHLKDVCDLLGANLVLAATGSPSASHFQLFLRVRPWSGQPLREKKLTCALNQITSLPQKAVRAASSLLDLENYAHRDKQAEPETHSAAAFTAYQTAESRMNQPGDSVLDAAIDQYKQATELDSHYALAHAKLALLPIPVSTQFGEFPKPLTSLIEIVRWRSR